MKIRLLIFLPMLFASFAFGQNTIDKNSVCTNQTVEKISSRGIRLGMTLQETFNLFAENNKLIVANASYSETEGRTIVTTGELELQPAIERHREYAKKNFGFSSISLSVKNKPNFDGISRYDLGFLDDRLTFFSVYYLKPKWENLRQFTDKLSETLDLPPAKEWIFNNRTSINCGDYTVEARESYQDEAHYSMLVSSKIDDILRQRRKKAEDQEREKDIKTFKP